MPEVAVRAIRSSPRVLSSSVSCGLMRTSVPTSLDQSPIRIGRRKGDAPYFILTKSLFPATLMKSISRDEREEYPCAFGQERERLAESSPGGVGKVACER